MARVGPAEFKRRTNASKKKRVIFAEAMGEWGTVKKACDLAGIARRTYMWWRTVDPDFVQAVDDARHIFAEGLEEIALERVKNPDKNRGSDVLLLGLLNANMPSKFRPQTAMSEDSAKELITEWRKASREVRKDQDVIEQEIPQNLQETLTEILEKRKDAPVGEEKSEDVQGDSRGEA
jgi:hypothetical protein